MSTTIVFACKSNSCRSQMAEAWAREWIRSERRGLENDEAGGHININTDDRERLRAFLDGLMVASVALDESSVAEPREGSMGASLTSVTDTPLGTSPTSSLTTSFPTRSCVTCDGEQCTYSSSNSKRRRPKEKAVQAMAQDGVDISSCYAKSVGQILPLVMRHHNSRQIIIDGVKQDWKRHLSFSGLRNMLEMASREMGMAYAGVVREDELFTTNSDNEAQLVDNLIVLCSCPDSMKCKLSGMSRDTLEWDIDPPSAMAARGGEGDGAYLRVSRQIRSKVDGYMNHLKQCALMVSEDDDCGGC